MPLLTFDALPPPLKTFGSAYIAQNQHTNGRGTPTVGKENDPPTPKPIVDTASKNTYPVVKLDVDTISGATAGRLATSLLGHVLFLKNQVPFPVMQLGRIPGGKPNSRAFKQRAELLASYDTISSHLDTTFSALATALAKCGNSGRSFPKVAQAHVAILVGPSLTTAKSKVILGFDGLEVRVWGLREDSTTREEESSDDDDAGEDWDRDEDEVKEEGSDDGEEEPEESEDEESSSEDGSENDEESSQEEQTLSHRPPASYISYAEEQKFLQTADRLLSRTLASADAEGNGITSEMSPTQTHVLIRAPRRFNHPAWIPRQNVTAALNASLQDFINNSGFSSAETTLLKQNSRKGKVEGVWITTRAGVQYPEETDTTVDVADSKTDDDDEMIWWSWDGKFVGLNDW